MFRDLTLRRIIVAALLVGAFFGAILVCGIVLGIATARAAPPVALTFLGYGQSTMASPGTNYYSSGSTCTYSGGQVMISGVSGTPFAAAVPGAAITAGGITPGSNPTITGFVSGTSGGNGVYTVSAGLPAGPTSCWIANETTFMTLLTGSNVTSNAFMIKTTPTDAGSPLLGPRGLYESVNSTNCDDSKPVSVATWGGFTPLQEIAYARSCNPGLGFNIETPMSSFVAQYAAQTGIAAPNAIIAENMAKGGEDWIASYPNILGPGGKNDWANLVSAQKYIKNNVQASSTLSGGAFSGGPWTYHLGGVPLRLGESAASASSLTVGATPPSTGSTTFLVTASPQALNGVPQPVAGWCAYDNNAAAFLGYVASWSGTTITLQANSLANGSAGDAVYLSPCYPGYLAEMKSFVAQLTASDVSDAPNPAGVPVFASTVSSSQFGSNNRHYQASINFATVAEGFADSRFVVAGPSFVGDYQSDQIHQEPQGEAIVGAYQGKWAAWKLSGLRTPPFAMISAERLTPSRMDGSHYGIRVTFQMPPSQLCPKASPSTTPGSVGLQCAGAASDVTAAQQQVLQFYTDANLPNWTAGNYGFCYLDGPYEAGGSAFAMWTSVTNGTCRASASGIAIASLPILATANSYSPGAANQIDIPLTGDPNTATNPTITLGANVTPNAITIRASSNAHYFYSQVANKDCTKAANAGLVGKAYANAMCNGGDGAQYLIDFASPSFIKLGQTIQPVW